MEKLSLIELKKLCKERNIKGISNKNKACLIELLTNKSLNEVKVEVNFNYFTKIIKRKTYIINTVFNNISNV